MHNELTPAETALLNRIRRTEREMLDCNLINTFAEMDAAKSLVTKGRLTYIHLFHAYEIRR